jgi:anaerobic ribonucleoside-triphosphate reductase activating protein
MKYGDIIYNDFTAGEGVSLTFFVQGCPIKCKGCHNPELQSFSMGKEFDGETMNSIIHGITANGVKRNLCIQGGEPLCEENKFLTFMVIDNVKKALPEVPVYIWTGYTLEEIAQRNDDRVNRILAMTDYLIDGPYIEEERDITLKMRGSKNQRILKLVDLHNKI